MMQAGKDYGTRIMSAYEKKRARLRDIRAHRERERETAAEKPLITPPAQPNKSP
jgi:hypothetical protein